MKEAYDPRGRQASILRLAAFDKEGLLHALTIRALTFVAIFAGAVLLFNLAFGVFAVLSKLLIILVWLLITPQMFEFAKGVVMMASEGRVFGQLNKPWLDATKYQERWFYSLYKFVPYAALTIWAVLFVAIVIVWFA